jgi:hypothetical protein
MTVTVAPSIPAPPADLHELARAGCTEAGAVEDPELRAAHREAWLLRTAALDPAAAAAMLREDYFDASTVAHAATLAAVRQVAQGAPDASSWWQAALEAIPPVPEDDLQLELLNQLCEAAMTAADQDPASGRDLLRPLAGVIPQLGGGEGGSAATQALAWALLGEALAGAGDPEGAAMLEHAAALGRGLPAQDHVLTFVAQSLAPTRLARAADLAAEIETPALRFDARLGLLQRAQAEAPALAAELLAVLEVDTEQLDDFRRIHALARLGTVGAEGGRRTADDGRQTTDDGPQTADGMAAPPSAVHRLPSAVNPEKARQLYERALDLIPSDQPQLQALQIAGLAASASTWDPAWAKERYDQALAAARAEPERVRRIVAQIAVAYQMAQADPAAAQPLLEAALREAPALEATWELAHVLEVLLDPRGRPEMDLQGALPLMEAALARVTDDDPRVPGVFGLPDAARAFIQVDPARAVAVCRRWYAAAEAAGDAEGMTEAALGIHHADPEAGQSALRETALCLAERGDGFAMSQFARAAAPAAPALAAAVARLIPESRERSRALAAAAAATWEHDPVAAGELLQLLPSPDERSAAMLTLFDRVAGTTNLPRPAAESDVSVCCSTIPQIPAGTADRLRAALEEGVRR